MSKSQNLGNLFRSANAFNAHFVFTINSNIESSKMKKIDTSNAYKNLPLYSFPSFESMNIPMGTSIIGVELLSDSLDLPQFYHPKQAIYILGPEKGVLSNNILTKCDFHIKIPTQFCINVAVAGAIIMYDRTISLNNYTDRTQLNNLKQKEKLKQLSKFRIDVPKDYSN